MTVLKPKKGLPSPDQIKAAIDAKPPALRDIHDARNYPARQDRKESQLGFGGGVDLLIQGGSRRWVSYVRLVGKRHKIALGTLDQIDDPHAARAKAGEARLLAKRGIDPRKHWESQKKVTPTFGEHATAYMKNHLPTLKNEKHRDKWEGSLRNHVKRHPIWNTKVDEVTVENVLDVLKPIWLAIPVMASEVRLRMEMILDDAANYGYGSLDFNPAKLTSRLQHSLGKKPPAPGATRGSHPSVPPEQLPEVMARLLARKAQTARAIAAVTLSCLRAQEFLEMHIDELNLDAEQPTWAIPYERFKVAPANHREPFILPLAPQFAAILREQIAELEEIHGKGRVSYIWPSSMQGTRGGKPPKKPYMSEATMLGYLQKSMKVMVPAWGGMRPATIHGMRSSFQTWESKQFLPGTGNIPRLQPAPKYNREAVDWCLAHKNPGGKTKGHYLRGLYYEARIPIMRDWADFCIPPKRDASAVDDNNVVPIRQTA
jgi:integrase